jgi:hypothetical protein
MDTHFPTHVVQSFSGGILINKEKANEVPREEMLNYAQKILIDHL